MANQTFRKVLWESIKNWLSSQNQKWHQQQRELLLQQQEQAVCMGQIYVQEALGQVLHLTNILPNLVAIENCTDLIPSGYEFGDVVIYSYRWLKKNSDKISTTVLEIARQKINTAIQMEIRRLEITFHTLPDYEKVLFIRQYPAFYSGFTVVGLKDAGTDVVISVVAN